MLILLGRVGVDVRFSKSVTDAKFPLRNLTGGVGRAGEDDLPMGKASILDKAVGKMDKVKALDFWLFRRSDTVVCRSSEKLLIIPTGMKPVSSVRLVGRRQSPVRPVCRTTKDWNC
jgi:hypothetical protein